MLCYYKIKILLTLSVAFLFTAGCSKGKKVRCKDDISEMPYYVAFVGFSRDVIDTINIYRYSDNPIDSDVKYTVIDTSLTVLNDTSSPILYFHPGWKYKITFPSNSALFELKDAQYPKGQEFDAIDNCLSARSNLSPPKEITVNGLKQNFIEISTNRAVVYLK